MLKLIIIFYLFNSFTLLAQISFDADFDSGNINNVSTNDSVTYYITTREDIGGRWFYLRISGVKDKFIKVKVSNSDCTRAMYSYDNSTFIRFSAAETPGINWFQKTYEEDTVWVAYYTPYSYTYLQERLAEWSKSEYVLVDTLGYTTHNFPMQEMILTDFSVPDENKKRVWIHARTHPGETPSSWHFDGIVQELLKDDQIIDFYRKNIVFYLYPFNNPEGVFYGRSRTNFDGVDQERDWDNTPNQTTKEVNMLKNRMIELNAEKQISVFLNLHSQAVSYCTFWIHTASSTSEFFYKRQYQFANLQTSDNDFFTQSDYRESNLQDYFPEGFQWNNYGDQVLALTYETPYDQYSNNIWVTNDNLFDLGSRTVYGIAEYLELSYTEYLILDNKEFSLPGHWLEIRDGNGFYSDNYYSLPPGNDAEQITFITEPMESGVYEIFGWWQSNSQNSYNTKFKIDHPSGTQNLQKSQRSNGGMWNLLSVVDFNSSGPISITITGSSNGSVVADAFRIIYKGPTTSVENDDLVSNSFKLFQNYPNPFNPNTTIRFKLSKPEKVLLKIYNSIGELVVELVNQNLEAGSHEIIFNTDNYPSINSGVYYYRMTAGKFAETKGMVLVK